MPKTKSKPQTRCRWCCCKSLVCRNHAVSYIKNLNREHDAREAKELARQEKRQTDLLTGVVRNQAQQLQQLSFAFNRLTKEFSTGHDDARPHEFAGTEQHGHEHDCGGSCGGSCSKCSMKSSPISPECEADDATCRPE